MTHSSTATNSTYPKVAGHCEYEHLCFSRFLFGFFGDARLVLSEIAREFIVQENLCEQGKLSQVGSVYLPAF